MRNKSLTAIRYKGCDLVRADYLVRARDFTTLDELSSIIDDHEGDTTMLLTTAAWNKAERLIVPLLESNYPHRDEYRASIKNAHLKA